MWGRLLLYLLFVVWIAAMVLIWAHSDSLVMRPAR